MKADLLCGLVVRVPGYRSRGPGSIEELLARESSGSGLERRKYSRRDPSR
jgi:hypothetical protein